MQPLFHLQSSCENNIKDHNETTGVSWTKNPDFLSENSDIRMLLFSDKGDIRMSLFSDKKSGFFVQ